MVKLDKATENKLGAIIAKKFRGIVRLLPSQLEPESLAGIEENIVWTPEEELEDGQRQARISEVVSNGVQECLLVILFSFLDGGKDETKFEPSRIEVCLQNYPEAGQKQVFPIEPHIEEMAPAISVPD